MPTRSDRNLDASIRSLERRPEAPHLSDFDVLMEPAAPYCYTLAANEPWLVSMEVDRPFELQYVQTQAILDSFGQVTCALYYAYRTQRVLGETTTSSSRQGAYSSGGLVHAHRDLRFPPKLWRNTTGAGQIFELGHLLPRAITLNPSMWWFLGFMLGTPASNLYGLYTSSDEEKSGYISYVLSGTFGVSLWPTEITLLRFSTPSLSGVRCPAYRAMSPRGLLRYFSG